MQLLLLYLHISHPSYTTTTRNNLMSQIINAYSTVNDIPWCELVYTKNKLDALTLQMV